MNAHISKKIFSSSKRRINAEAFKLASQPLLIFLHIILILGNNQVSQQPAIFA